jgi:hypothetical protein
MGRDAHAVWVNDAVMVVGGNSWSSELQALPCQEPWEWIEAHRAHVLVNSTMYMA